MDKTMDENDFGESAWVVSPDKLVSGFIKVADLFESGQYIKVSLAGEPPRVVTVWIDHAVLRAQAGERVRESLGLDRASPFAEQLEAVLSLDLFEALTSIRPTTTDIALNKHGYFQPLSKPSDVDNRDC